MPREMLKLRKGDSAIKIKADGQVELAGVQDKSLVDDKGNISPVILFAAAWAKKDENLLNHLVDNFSDNFLLISSAAAITTFEPSFNPSPL